MATPTASHARRVYSAEELRQLRHSFYPKPDLAQTITESEDCELGRVKEHINLTLYTKWMRMKWRRLAMNATDLEQSAEHVLRSTKSLQAQSWRSRASSCRTLTDNNQSLNKVKPPAKGVSDENFAALGVARRMIGPPQNECLEIVQRDHGQPSSQSRDSPTPSIKRKKVEAIVKLHGSPTHVRVTAGGRIVPKEQSPLCYPRYGYSAIKANGGLIKFAPNRPLEKADWTQATQNGFIAQDVEGRMCQIVNGTVLPLTEVNGVMKLYLPAPNLNITHSDTPDFHQSSAEGNRRMSRPRGILAPKIVQEPASSTQIQALESQYMRFESELKDINKVEVVHGRTMSKIAKDNLVLKRRELVTTMDRIRKSLKSLRVENQNDIPVYPLPADNQYSMPRPFPRDQALNTTKPELRQWSGSSDQQFPPSAMVNGLVIPSMTLNNSNVPSTHGFLHSSWKSPIENELTQPFQPALQQTIPDGPAPVIPQYDSDFLQDKSSNFQGGPHLARFEVRPARRSHALPITNPSKGENIKSAASILNPTSPAYRPLSGGFRKDNREFSPTLEQDAPHRCDMMAERASNQQSIELKGEADQNTSPGTARCSNRQQSSSSASFDTVDFFPSNTHEYSTRKYDYSAPESHLDGKSLISQDQPATSRPPQPLAEDAYTTLDGVDDSGKAQEAEPRCSQIRDQQSTYVKSESGDNLTKDDLSSSNMESNKAASSLSPPEQELLASKKNCQHDSQHHRRNSENACPKGPAAMISRSPRRSHDESYTDLTIMSSDWIRGYQEGLNCRVISSNHLGDFLDGYCSGLLKNKQLQEANFAPKQGTVNPSSPRSFNATSLPPPLLGDLQNVAFQIPLRGSSATNALKKAIQGPENEYALLTPAADDPHVADVAFDLGSWQRRRSLSDVEREVTHEESSTTPQPLHDLHRARVEATAAEASKYNIPAKIREQASECGLSTSPRVAIHAQPRARVFSIGESRSRVAETGTPLSNQRKEPHLRDVIPTSPNKIRFGGPAKNVAHTITNTELEYQSRFTEVSFDGTTNTSMLHCKRSPSSSPKKSPTKPKTSSAMIKPGSPARAKIDAIAEKVGIKVTPSPTEVEPSSPSSRRRWRAVWRSRRNSDHKDE